MKNTIDNMLYMYTGNMASIKVRHWSTLYQIPGHFNALIFNLNGAGDLTLFPSALRSAEAYATGGVHRSAVARA